MWGAREKLRGLSAVPPRFPGPSGVLAVTARGGCAVARGAGAPGRGVTAEVVLALAATVAVACALWWIYFAYLPRLTEERLRRSREEDDITNVGGEARIDPVGGGRPARAARKAGVAPTPSRPRTRWLTRESRRGFCGRSGRAAVLAHGRVARLAASA